VDNLTHSLVGYTLARTGLGRGSPAPALTLVLASNVPDADIVRLLTAGGVAYLDAHRGFTHGPLGCVLLAGIVAGGVMTGALGLARRRRTAIERPARAALQTFALALFGTVLHVLMDVPTSYGTRVLSPFSETWYAFDWMPIIDVYLWLALVVGLVWSHVAPRLARRLAIALLVLTAADYAARASLHHRALQDAAARTAQGKASPCAASPTLVRHPTLVEAAIAGPGSCIVAAALPTFLSPMKWRAIRQYPGGYELSERRIGHADVASHRVWLPSEAGPLVARARATPTARVFLNFSRFPAARIVQTSPDAATVRLVDVRFVGNPIEWDPQARARTPFVVTVILNRAGRVLDERLGN
jgi:inner membrane protein